MEPFTDDENAQEQEPASAAPADNSVATGSAPYEAADEDDFEED